MGASLSPLVTPEASSGSFQSKGHTDNPGYVKCFLKQHQSHKPGEATGRETGGWEGLEGDRGTGKVPGEHYTEQV